MKYPDGTLIAVHDLVWWNGGIGIGHITAVFESAEECLQVGLSEPSIFICYDGSDSNDGASVIYPERAFVEDGIGRLTKEEEAEVADVISRSRLALPTTIDAKMSCGVIAEYHEGKRTRWRVVYYLGQKPQLVVAVTPDMKDAHIIPQ